MSRNGAPGLAKNNVQNNLLCWSLHLEFFSWIIADLILHLCPWNSPQDDSWRSWVMRVPWTDFALVILLTVKLEGQWESLLFHCCFALSLWTSHSVQVMSQDCWTGWFSVVPTVPLLCTNRQQTFTVFTEKHCMCEKCWASVCASISYYLTHSLLGSSSGVTVLKEKPLHYVISEAICLLKMDHIPSIPSILCPFVLSVQSNLRMTGCMHDHCSFVS